MKVVTATLTIQVTAKLGNNPKELLQTYLNDIVEHAANRGLFTGESDMEVADLFWHVMLGEEQELKE